MEISAFEENDRLYIQIEDDGEGMDQEKVAEIVRFINTEKPVEEKKNITLKFRGSENQRLINIPKTLKSGKVILWDK